MKNVSSSKNKYITILYNQYTQNTTDVYRILVTLEVVYNTTILSLSKLKVIMDSHHTVFLHNMFGNTRNVEVYCTYRQCKIVTFLYFYAVKHCNMILYTAYPSESLSF